MLDVFGTDSLNSDGHTVLVVEQAILNSLYNVVSCKSSRAQGKMRSSVAERCRASPH